jgi:hypothetical protein
MWVTSKELEWLALEIFEKAVWLPSERAHGEFKKLTVDLSAATDILRKHVRGLFITVETVDERSGLVTSTSQRTEEQCLADTRDPVWGPNRVARIIVPEVKSPPVKSPPLKSPPSP